MPEIKDDEGAEIFDDFEPQEQSNGHDKPRFTILSKAQFKAMFVPPDYVVDGILQRGFLYALTGPTSHAKSAIALLITELMSSPDKNSMFGSHRVEKGRVLYLVGENPVDLCMRVIGADSKRFDDTEDDQVFFIPGQLDLDKEFTAIAAAVAEIGGDLSLVIVDTSAAYFLGEDENVNTQMGTHARKLRRLSTLPGLPCVLVLCHPTKNPQPDNLLPRGGGAFLAELDGNLTAWKSDTLVQMHYTKMRGPGFEPMTFRLETIETPELMDSKGRLLTTVRAVVIGQAEEDRQRDKTDDDDDAVLMVRLKVGPEAKLSIAGFAEQCGWLYGDGSPAKSRAQRALSRNVQNKLMFQDRGQFLLTEKRGFDAARKAALRTERQQTADSQSGFEFVH